MYPTKERIMERLPPIKEEVLTYMKFWKELWIINKKHSNEYKLNTLTEMLHNLADIYKKPINVQYSPESSTAYYECITKTIHITKSLSIISALHEFAHHIFGKSELQACRWSVSVYSKTFPKSFEKLKWEGHMLVKNKDQKYEYTQPNNSLHDS